MKLWILARATKVEYDEFYEFLVRAETSEEARKLAYTRDQTPDRWLASWATTCVEVTPEGTPEILIEVFNAG